MKYLILILFVLNICTLKGQELPLIESFVKQHFNCHRVNFFSELKKKVDGKKNNKNEVYYLIKNNQILGFICSKDFGDPRFFIGSEGRFTIFQSEGIDDAVSVYETVLRNPYSVYSVEIKKKSIQYMVLQWKYKNWPTSASQIWKFKRDSVSEFSAYPTDKLKPMNLGDTLIYHNKFDIFNDLRFEKTKLVRVQENNNNLRPSILVFLMNLTKEL